VAITSAALLIGFACPAIRSPMGFAFGGNTIPTGRSTAGMLRKSPHDRGYVWCKTKRSKPPRASASTTCPRLLSVVNWPFGALQIRPCLT
jgi:hypothetical protein